MVGTANLELALIKKYDSDWCSETRNIFCHKSERISANIYRKKGSLIHIPVFKKLAI